MCIAAVIVLAACRSSQHLDHIPAPPGPSPPLPRPNPAPVRDDSAPVPPPKRPMVQRPTAPFVTVTSSTASASSSNSQQSTDQLVAVPVVRSRAGLSDLNRTLTLQESANPSPPITVPATSGQQAPPSSERLSQGTSDQTDTVSTTHDGRTSTAQPTRRVSNPHVSTNQATLSNASTPEPADEPTTPAINPEQSSTAQIRSSDISASQQPTNREPPIDDRQAFTAQLLRFVAALNHLQVEQPIIGPGVGDGHTSAAQTVIPDTITFLGPDNEPIGAAIEESSDTQSPASAITTSEPPEFFCSIHQELHPRNVLVRIRGCDHEYCRDGLKDHIRSKLSASRVPSCPLCMAMPRTDGSPPNSLFHFSLHLTTI